MKKNRLLSIVSIILLVVLSSGCVRNRKGVEANVERSNVELENKKEMTFKKIDPKELENNPISLFADNWFVVSSGDSTKFNEMTISWGNLGNVWDEPSITIYIRNTRYTYTFIDGGKYFVLNSFDEEYRDKVKFIGTHTGSKTDKVKETGLTPKFTELGNPYFDEARLVIECEKMYYDDIDRTHLFEKGKEMYSSDSKETHRIFIGRIVNVWVKR